MGRLLSTLKIYAFHINIPGSSSLLKCSGWTLELLSLKPQFLLSGTTWVGGRRNTTAFKPLGLLTFPEQLFSEK